MKFWTSHLNEISFSFSHPRFASPTFLAETEVSEEFNSRLSEWTRKEWKHQKGIYGFTLLKQFLGVITMTLRVSMFPFFNLYCLCFPYWTFFYDSYFVYLWITHKIFSQKDLMTRYLHNKISLYTCCNMIDAIYFILALRISPLCQVFVSRFEIFSFHSIFGSRFEIFLLGTYAT